MLGEGDGEAVTFQLVKAYGASDAAYTRPIAKPVAGSVLVAIDGDALAAEAFSVNAATGVVTFTTAPGEGAIITAGFLFDTPVRFDLDRLDLALDGFGAGRAITVPLVEIIG